MTNVSRKKVLDWYSFCRDIGSKTLMNNPL